jgi:hypothetical protein
MNFTGDPKLLAIALQNIQSKRKRCLLLDLPNDILGMLVNEWLDPMSVDTLFAIRNRQLFRRLRNKQGIVVRKFEVDSQASYLANPNSLIGKLAGDLNILVVQQYSPLGEEYNCHYRVTDDIVVPGIIIQQTRKLTINPPYPVVNTFFNHVHTLDLSEAQDNFLSIFSSADDQFPSLVKLSCCFCGTIDTQAWRLPSRIQELSLAIKSHPSEENTDDFVGMFKHLQSLRILHIHLSCNVPTSSAHTSHLSTDGFVRLMKLLNNLEEFNLRVDSTASRMFPDTLPGLRPQWPPKLSTISLMFRNTDHYATPTNTLPLILPATLHSFISNH